MIWMSLRRLSLWACTLNTSKCQIICQDDTAQGNLIMTLPGAKIVIPERACLLGSPLGCVASIDASLEEKIVSLKTMDARFNSFFDHDSLTLFVIPLLFPSSITSCGQRHASCLDSWRNTIPLCVPS